MATIAALFDDRDRAERALGALMESRLAGHRSRIIRAETHRTEMAPFREATPAPAGGGGGLPLGIDLPAVDRAAFEAALDRGGCLLSAEIVGDLDQAIAIVETFEPVDLDRHSQERAGQAGGQDGDRLGVGLAGGMAGGMTNTAALPGMGGMAESTHDVGSSDLRTTGAVQARHGPQHDRHRRHAAEERAGAPGVGELAAGAGPASGTGAEPGLRRDPTRTGRVRSYVSG
jgi:hypothetical protein